jgi:hypothetical protein
LSHDLMLFSAADRATNKVTREVAHDKHGFF